MSSYLEIAEQVLKLQRVPMGPRAIIKEAYLLNLMPFHLYGETQHKTLQARLSEDILYLKNRSRFIRTEPGKFFLRSLLADETIPVEFRKTVTARRRKREVISEPVLCVAKDSLEKLTEGIYGRKPSVFDELRHSGGLSYFKFKQTPSDHLPIWAFVVFKRENEVLSYRVGRYRAHEEDLNSKRTIGFTSLVTEYQQTLFNQETLGIVESGMTALSLDLDFPLGVDAFEVDPRSEISIIPVAGNDDIETILVVFTTECPPWFQPTTRRLSMNDMKWISYRVPPNHLEDFDSWSQAVVQHKFSGGG